MILEPYSIHRFWILENSSISGKRSINDGSHATSRLPYPRGNDDDDKTIHYHNHQHYHHDDEDDAGNTRSIFHTDQVPAYQVKSNRDLVEATFVFPNKKDNYDKSFGDNFHDLVIEGRNLSSPLLAPDSFFSNLPKRSINPDTFSNRTGRSINGFVKKSLISQD